MDNKCEVCTEKCPQAERAHQTALGRMYATKEFVALLKKVESGELVEVESLRAWLYEIAMNNTDNPLSDACDEIISRLDGLRAFARERKDHG